jgi:hypothetical protein
MRKGGGWSVEGCKRRGENDAAVAAKSCRRIANVCAQASASKENISRKGKGQDEKRKDLRIGVAPRSV